MPKPAAAAPASVSSWKTCFREVAGVRSFTAFGALTLPQQECAARTKECYSEIMENKSREKFLKELYLCVTGYGVEDQDEPITTSCFSQYSFYDMYIRLQYHRDLFDFLLTCVMHKVCVVAPIYTSRYRDMIKQLCTPLDYSCIPEWVVTSVTDELELDEIARQNAFFTKRDWAQLTKEQKLVILSKTSDTLPYSLASFSGASRTQAMPGDPIAQFMF